VAFTGAGAPALQVHDLLRRDALWAARQGDGGGDFRARDLLGAVLGSTAATGAARALATRLRATLVFATGLATGLAVVRVLAFLAVIWIISVSRQ
jgi:hypothetical protein